MAGQISEAQLARRFRAVGLALLGFAWASASAGQSAAEQGGAGHSAFSSRDAYSGNGDIWRPLASIVLPGFDQYLNGKLAAGLGYTAFAIGGHWWTADLDDRISAFQRQPKYNDTNDDGRFNLKRFHYLYRDRMVAQKLTWGSGELSAYQSFRTAATARQRFGQYAFLEPAKFETPAQLALAPFKFSYLKRTTTWLPLLLNVGLYAALSQDLPEEWQRRELQSSDAPYIGGLSYLAGVTEESSFRGVLQPLFYEYTNSAAAANIGQALLFAASHGDRVNPLFLFGWGYYLGWLTERNDWQIGESIFVHTWLDVASITATYMIQKKAGVRHPAIYLPKLRYAF